MRYIISESRLEGALEKVFNQYINLDELKYYHPVEETEDGEEYDDTNRTAFYLGEDPLDGEQILWYYECDYFDENAVDIRRNCPLLRIESNIKDTFDGIFGDFWVEPFKKWINYYLDLNVKKIDYL